MADINDINIKFPFQLKLAVSRFLSPHQPNLDIVSRRDDGMRKWLWLTLALKRFQPPNGARRLAMGCT